MVCIWCFFGSFSSVYVYVVLLKLWNQLIPTSPVPQPEVHKLNKDEWWKTHEQLQNYISIIRKFLDQNPKTGWAKSTRFLEQLYAESNHPMLITPLCLRSLTVTNLLLLHVLQQLAAEQRRKAKHGGKKLNLTKKGILFSTWIMSSS